MCAIGSDDSRIRSWMKCEKAALVAYLWTLFQRAFHQRVNLLGFLYQLSGINSRSSHEHALVYIDLERSQADALCVVN